MGLSRGSAFQQIQGVLRPHCRLTLLLPCLVEGTCRNGVKPLMRTEGWQGAVEFAICRFQGVPWVAGTKGVHVVPEGTCNSLLCMHQFLLKMQTALGDSANLHHSAPLHIDVSWTLGDSVSTCSGALTGCPAPACHPCSTSVPPPRVGPRPDGCRLSWMPPGTRLWRLQRGGTTWSGG